LETIKSNSGCGTPKDSIVFHGGLGGQNPPDGLRPVFGFNEKAEITVERDHYEKAL
jgi:hypothetical protein